MKLNKIKRASEIIKNSNNLIISAGAGMSVDSGLPDFRGPEGFWREYPQFKKLNIFFQKAANPELFENRPNLAWAFYGHRFNLYKRVTPHSGFNILLKWAKLKKNYFVISSNVDGHFYKSGFSEDKVLEIHGNINYFQCNSCNYIIEIDDNYRFQVDEEKFEVENDHLPKCRKCNELLRPNILMFDDWTFNFNRVNSQRTSYYKFMNQCSESDRSVIIELGAGLAVPNIRIISESLLRNTNNFLIRINVKDSQCNIGNEGDNYISLEYSALEALQLLDKEILE